MGRVGRARSGISVIAAISDAGEDLSPFLSALRRSDVVEVFLCARSNCRRSATTARAAGAHVLGGEMPLAETVNRALAQLRGEAVWFLHPACRPGPGFAACILAGLEEPARAGGWFRIRSGGRFGGALRANFAAAWGGRIGWRHGPFLRTGAETETVLESLPDGDAALARLMRRAPGARIAVAPIRLTVERPAEARGPDLS